jgi:NAD(P)-dependent dehydrogenase (short-subunit alcohol dehydrogenase family)
MANWATYPSLGGRSVLVTGGASGIGAALVNQFHVQGARVAFVDIDASAGAALVSDLSSSGPPPLFLPCDLTDIEALKRAVALIESELGAVRVLVNNAARDDRHGVTMVTPESWNAILASNLNHQFFASQAVVPAMTEAGGGSIINMGSISWLIAEGGMPGYLTSKAAIVGLTRGLARDLGPRGIRVNCVLPGWTMTERQVALWLTPEGERELMRRQCLKRKLMPDDVARMVLFLAADDSAMCTSQSYIVDGGWA